MKIIINESQLETILFKGLLNEENSNTSLFGGVTPKIISTPEDHKKRPLGNWSSDDAWDIKAPIGTPVYSLTKGKVTKIHQSSGKNKSIYGTQISISGIDDYPSIFYTHLDSVKLKKGDLVNPGDYIGKITRWDSNPDLSHVHIGIKGGSGNDIKKFMSDNGKIKNTEDLIDNIKNGEIDLEDTEKLLDKIKNKKGKNIDDKINEFLTGLLIGLGKGSPGAAKYIDKLSKKLKKDIKVDDIEDDKNIKSKTNFANITKRVIDKFEGGYWNGTTSENKKTSKLGICSNHPKGSMGQSTETMFGLDRYNGNIESTLEGKEFFQIIDKEKEELGIENFCKKWKWLYRGGDKEEKLKDLAIKIMEKRFNKNMDNYVKDDDVKQKILSNPGLLLHMSYATWNGPGFFQKFAKELTNAVKNGKSDSELVDVAIDSRAETGLLNKGKVETQIKELNNT